MSPVRPLCPQQGTFGGFPASRGHSSRLVIQGRRPGRRAGRPSRSCPFGRPGPGGGGAAPVSGFAGGSDLHQGQRHPHRPDDGAHEGVPSQEAVAARFGILISRLLAFHQSPKRSSSSLPLISAWILPSSWKLTKRSRIPSSISSRQCSRISGCTLSRTSSVTVPAYSRAFS